MQKHETFANSSQSPENSPNKLKKMVAASTLGVAAVLGACMPGHEAPKKAEATQTQLEAPEALKSLEESYGTIEQKGDTVTLNFGVAHSEIAGADEAHVGFVSEHEITTPDGKKFTNENLKDHVTAVVSGTPAANVKLSLTDAAYPSGDGPEYAHNLAIGIDNINEIDGDAYITLNARTAKGDTDWYFGSSINE